MFFKHYFSTLGMFALPLRQISIQLNVNISRTILMFKICLNLLFKIFQNVFTGKVKNENQNDEMISIKSAKRKKREKMLEKGSANSLKINLIHDKVFEKKNYEIKMMEQLKIIRESQSVPCK